MKRTKYWFIAVLLLPMLIGIGEKGAWAADAKTNFQHYCAQCHGPEGKGDGINATPDLPVTPRNLTDGSDMGSFTDEQVFNTLTKGGIANDLSTIMPPWGDTLTREEIQDLVKFVREMCNCVFDPTLRRKPTVEKPIE